MTSALDKLPPKRRVFVEAYCGEAAGNATEAARIARYAHPSQQGHRLLRNAQVQAALAELTAPERNRRVATREERLAFYTGVMEDPAQQTKDRLKAAELLGKVGGDFVVKVEVETKNVPASREEALARLEELRSKLKEGA